MHNFSIVIYIYYKLNGILSIGYLVMAEDGKVLTFRQSNVITDDIPIKLRAHNLTMVIYIQYNFYQIPSISYLVMAEDGKNHGNFGNQRVITKLYLMTTQ